MVVVGYKTDKNRASPYADDALLISWLGLSTLRQTAISELRR